MKNLRAKVWAKVSQKKTRKRNIVMAVAVAIALLSAFGVLPAILWILVALGFLYKGLIALIRVLRKQIKVVDSSDDDRVKSKLLPGESVVIATREHPVAILLSIFTIRTVIILAIGAGIGYKAGSVATIVMGIALALALRVIWRYYIWKADILVLTNWRIFVVSGLLSRELEIIWVKNLGGSEIKISFVSLALSWVKLIEKPFGNIKASGIGTIFERFSRTPDIAAFDRALNIVQAPLKS